jgi:molybdopterin/thiamine biosynthesis adenylyltransferase
LARCHALVIGVGAIGRQVACQLAAIGVRKMTLFDEDVVGVENLAAQAYWPQDLGRRKVEATGALCRQLLPELQLRLCAQRFARSSVRGWLANQAAAEQSVVFACVDEISTRRVLFDSLSEHASLFVDGRMAAEVARVLAVERPAHDEYYRTTLFGPEQAYRGPCTARSTIYGATLAASLMLAQFSRWLRGQPLDRDVTLNLLAMELTVR